MNLNKMFKKLVSNQAVMILAAVVVAFAVYSYSQGFNVSLSGMTGENEAAQASSQEDGNPFKNHSAGEIKCAAGGNNFVPADNNANNNASANGASTDTYGLPPSCAKQNVVDPSELLPKGSDNEFSKINPSGSGDLKNVSFLKAGYHIGINTVGQSLRNANLQLRSEPPNPQLNTGPWNNSTITADVQRRPLELGCGN